MNILNRRIKETIDNQIIGEQCIVTDDQSTLLIVKTTADRLPDTLETITHYFSDPTFNVTSSATKTSTNTSLVRINGIPYLTKQYLLKKISNPKSEYHKFVDYQSEKEISDQDIRMFINSHYSSNLMDLVVVGS